MCRCSDYFFMEGGLLVNKLKTPAAGRFLKSLSPNKPQPQGLKDSMVSRGGYVPESVRCF